jgi:hypothetical protein
LTLDQQPNTKSTLSDKKRISLIAIAIIIVALVVTGASYGLLSTNQTNNNLASNTDNSTPPSTTTNQPTTPTSWITKGIYAIYQGQAEILSMNIQFNARMEVIDLNSTHVKIQTSFDMDSSLGTTENTTSAWVNREEMNFQPEDLNLTNSFTTQVTLPNLGTRSCIVYEYSNQDISAAFYIDNTLQWPLKMTMTSPVVDGQSYNMDVTMVDSNIPGL